jgi:FAD/FMN-containing dehydrogenase
VSSACRPPGATVVSRRGLLQSGAVGAALLATGCTATDSGTQATHRPGATSRAGSAPASTGAASARRPHARDWAELGRSVDGDVVRRADTYFQQASELFDPRYDRVRPLAVVEATSPQDVATAIAFARRFALRVRPKAGGHSYVGASTVSNGLVIDVGRIRRVRYDAATRTASVGAGAALYDVHAALAGDGRTIPTGTCPTVGAAGLTLGGGVGVASREHGLTCDQLVGVTIVTADGQTRVAAADREQELFWACRGGGGGNVGIVTSMRYATQPARRTGFFLLSFPWSQAARVIRGWAARAADMKRSSWSNLHLEASAGGSTAVRVVGACRAGDEDAEASGMEAAAGVSATSRQTSEKSFLDGVVFLGGGTTSARQSFTAGSDVIPVMTAALARALVSVMERKVGSGLAAAAILDPLTGAVGDVPSDASAFPWRDHLCDIQWYVGLPASAAHPTMHAARAWIGSAHAAVSGHSAGGYVNYLEPKRAVRDYYGPNYPRLQQIKHEIDPTGFFRSPFTVE